MRERAIEAWRGELAALAVAIAEALLQRELVQGLPDVEPLLIQALAELDPHERATITVEPGLLESVAAWARTRWPAAVVRADAALGPGELRVGAPSGAIDGTRAARLARARALVLGEVDAP
ncbi:MAG: FliH/SctL family protein [Nannocystaceae bacterium]